MLLKFKKLFLLFFLFILSSEIHVMAFEVKENGVCEIEGVDYPVIGYGTYPLQGKNCMEAVSEAARIGYRIFDTATFYGNFEPIGKGLNALGRQNFYIISKVWFTDQTPQKLKNDLEKTLQKLNTSYLDAYLLHWPDHKIPIEDTLEAMEQLRSEGLIRHIGLSNVNANHLKRALEVGVPISWVQVEMHPFFCDFELLEFCQKNSITIQAWAPLSRGSLVQNKFLVEIGKKYAKTPSQISLKWIIQHGCVPLPASKNKLHMQENFESINFNLSPEDMQLIDEKAKHGKRERFSGFLSIHDEFDFTYEQCWPKH